MQSDPIADFLTVLRNASRASKAEVVVNYSRMKNDIAQVLQKEGYLASVEKIGDKVKPQLKIALRGTGKTRALVDIQRASRAGLRRYVGAKEIPRVLGGLGVAVVSTSKGVMAGHVAKKQNLGGELLLTVY